MGFGFWVVADKWVLGGCHELQCCGLRGGSDGTAERREREVSYGSERQREEWLTGLTKG